MEDWCPNQPKRADGGRRVRGGHDRPLQPPRATEKEKRLDCHRFRSRLATPRKPSAIRSPLSYKDGFPWFPRCVKRHNRKKEEY